MYVSSTYRSKPYLRYGASHNIPALPPPLHPSSPTLPCLRRPPLAATVKKNELVWGNLPAKPLGLQWFLSHRGFEFCQVSRGLLPCPALPYSIRPLPSPTLSCPVCLSIHSTPSQRPS